MEFHLARALGRTVTELRHTLSAKEYGEWVAFYNWEQKEREKAERHKNRR